jgi:hypothetical protein
LEESLRRDDGKATIRESDRDPDKSDRAQSEARTFAAEAVRFALGVDYPYALDSVVCRPQRREPADFYQVPRMKVEVSDDEGASWKDVTKDVSEFSFTLNWSRWDTETPRKPASQMLIDIVPIRAESIRC